LCAYNDQVCCVGAFLPQDVNKCSKFPLSKVILKNIFVKKSCGQHDLGIYWLVGERGIKHSSL